VAQVSGDVGVSPAITATNNTYGTTGGGSITPLTVTAAASTVAGQSGSVGFDPGDPWITPQIMTFKGDIVGADAGDNVIINVDTRSDTSIANIETLRNLSPSGKVYITHIDGTRIQQGTIVTGTSSANGGSVFIDKPNTLGSTATLDATTFLLVAQNTPAIIHTWPNIVADVGGSITWPSITTTASSTGSFTNSTQNSEVSIGVITPDGYQEMTRYDVTGAKDNQQFTVSASTTFWKIPSGPITPDSWTSTFNWNLAMQTVGTVKPTITNISQRFLIYDCGVAS
jgi:hypothetical protein